MTIFRETVSLRLFFFLWKKSPSLCNSCPCSHTPNPEKGVSVLLNVLPHHLETTRVGDRLQGQSYVPHNSDSLIKIALLACVPFLYHPSLLIDVAVFFREEKSTLVKGWVRQSHEQGTGR